jgi:NAD(P)-dependent dehydrogenase (short-subunit alcohol dehydrogenase family)
VVILPNDNGGLPAKYVLVTGSSSGIGREMSVALSRDYRLILNGRDETRIRETLAKCSDPSKHLIWRYDLADVDGIAASMAELLTPQVRVSGFVHCAALLKVLPLRSQPLSMFRDNLNVNFLSAVEILSNLTKKKVNDRCLSSVVFISSIASMFGAKGFGAYSASKGALDSFMKVMSVELAPQVRLNSVLPGAVKTPMTAHMFDTPEIAERFKRDYPLGVGTADDVIAAVAFLLSENARWITGQQIVVDGGRTVNITG